MTIEVVSAKSRYDAPLNNFFPFEKLSFGGRQSNVSMTIVMFISCQFHSHIQSSLDQVYIAQLLQNNLQFRWVIMWRNVVCL